MNKPPVTLLAALALATLALQGCGRSDAEAANAAGARGATGSGEDARRRERGADGEAAERRLRLDSGRRGRGDRRPARRAAKSCGERVPLPASGGHAPLPKRREAARKLGELAKQLEKQFGPPTDTCARPLPPPETAVLVDVEEGEIPVQERGLAAGFDMYREIAKLK